MRRLAWLPIALAALAMGGCVRRVIDITSDPPGARVWVNDREAGRTPCSIEFTHYGRYDVRLRREGFEPVVGFGDADAPVWDFMGCDLVSEVVPAQLTSRVRWHFTMIPTDMDEAALVQRARAMRTGLAERGAEVVRERGGEAPVLNAPAMDAVPAAPTVLTKPTPAPGG
jgi:PEGA domain